jgi:hypothetical protein
MGMDAATVSHSQRLKGFRYIFQPHSSFSGCRINTEDLDKTHLLYGMIVMLFKHYEGNRGGLLATKLFMQMLTSLKKLVLKYFTHFLIYASWNSM